MLVGFHQQAIINAAKFLLHDGEIEAVGPVDVSGINSESRITNNENILNSLSTNDSDLYPYKYIELPRLKPCPLPFGTVCGIMRGKFFEAEGEKQISPA